MQRGVFVRDERVCAAKEKHSDTPVVKVGDYLGDAGAFDITKMANGRET